MDLDRAMTPEIDELLRAFSEALIQYTPEHFREIRCSIRQRAADGRTALHYTIECPQFPDDGTERPSPEMHEIACALVDYWERDGEPFRGVILTCKARDDGTWENALELLA